MDVVKFVTEFPEKPTVGLSPEAYNLCKWHAKMGHNVNVVALTKGKEGEKELDGFKVYWIKKPRMQRIFAGKILIEKTVELGLKPEVVHGMNPATFGWLFPIAKKNLGTKYCFSMHGSTEQLRHLQLSKSGSIIESIEYGMLCKYLAKKADVTTVHSEFLKMELEKAGINEKKIVVVRNGVDFKLFNGAAKERKGLEKQGRQKKGEKSGKFRLLYVGRFAEWKGVQYLLKAVEMLMEKGIGNEIELRLIGGREVDDYYGTIVEISKSNGLKGIVKVVEPKPYGELPKEYAKADCFVLPSLYEPFGRVLIEAMAARLPVIATDVAGPKEFIENGKNGLLVEPGNSGKLAKAIEMLIEDAGLRKKLAANAERAAKGFDWKYMAEDYLKAYRIALDN